VGLLQGEPRGLIALDYPFALTCNVWWLAVHPAAHRKGLGRALLDRVAEHARDRGCRFLTVETMSPRDPSPEYAITRRFYEAVGFMPLVETETAAGDWMLWMLRPL
jgi:GNAT superfamily N-acetyltransferase